MTCLLSLLSDVKCIKMLRYMYLCIGKSFLQISIFLRAHLFSKWTEVKSGVFTEAFPPQGVNIWSLMDEIS